MKMPKGLAQTPKPFIKSAISEPDTTTENIYKVPLKQWNKWTDEGKAPFNYLYRVGTYDSGVIFSTDIFKVEGDTQIDEIIASGSWNLAWMAADKISAK